MSGEGSTPQAIRKLQPGKLVIASHNKGKVREIADLLAGRGFDVVSAADADANFVLLENGHIAEAQATAEHATYDEEALLRLLRLARIGCADIFRAQSEAIR